MYFQTDPDLNEKFIKSGILPDRKIALLCKNSEEYVKLLIQIIFWGGVAIPVSTVMPTAKVHSMLKNINCSKIIVGEGIEYKDDVLIRSFSLKYFSEKLVNINLRKTT